MPRPLRSRHSGRLPDNRRWRRGHQRHAQCRIDHQDRCLHGHARGHARRPEPSAPALDALTPGLWEGLTSRTANDPFRYVPKQNVRLTTYAANNGNSVNTSNSGGMWAGNNHTYAYAGCIWNRTATNQVWNFRGAFDDYVYLVIDRSLVLYRNGNTATPGSFTATPGPHYFDARFGDGWGNVGCNVSGMLNSGLNWDPGDGMGWRVVSDPGDGSILTTSSVNWDAAEAARNAQPGQPGLFEGTVGGCGNSVEPNPCDGGVQLTPRAANGFINVPDGNDQSATLPNGYVWWNYSSAVYSGYVWNRSGETQELDLHPEPRRLLSDRHRRADGPLGPPQRHGHPHRHRTRHARPARL
ncbi:MAG: hypothetical protein ACOX7Q_05750 [Kiritimatiellia bacterium]